MPIHAQPNKHPKLPPSRHIKALQIPIPEWIKPLVEQHQTAKTKTSNAPFAPDASLARTMRTRAMLMGISPALRAAGKVAAAPKKKIARQPPPFTKERFNTLTKKLGSQLSKYREHNYQNKVELPDPIWAQMEPKNAHYLHANNMTSRDEFAWICADVVGGQFKKVSGPLFWITLTPKKFGLNFEEACKFDVRKIQKWAQAVLPGVSFVGMVEGGCFPVQQSSYSRIEVSFHVHLVGWGVSEAKMEMFKASINERFPSYVPNSLCAHSVPVTPEEAEKYSWYMGKPPSKEMRFVPHLEEMNWETGEIFVYGEDRFNKRPIRTGHLANMCLVMEKQTLDGLVFCAGHGKPLVKEIRHRALSKYRSEERRRRDK